MTVTFLSDSQIPTSVIRACGLLAHPSTVPTDNHNRAERWSYWDGRFGSKWSKPKREAALARLLQAGATDVRFAELNGRGSAEG